MGMSYQGYNSQQFFAHRFCELRIWNRALSTTEINANMCGADPQSEGLVAYWKFNEGNGLTITDHTGNGNDGVAKSPVKWTPVTLPEPK